MSLRSPSVGAVLCVVLQAVMFGPVNAPAAEARPDLTGVVTTQAGLHLTNASLFIYTAGPRLGPGILCPSCYADCRKRAKSGPQGEFTIKSLDPRLLFQVLVVAPGHVPTFFNKVDPLKGPLQAKLKARPALNVPSTQVILGQVIDAAKKPLPNAVVSVNSTTIGNRTGSRPPGGTDPLVVTDEEGNFLLASQGKFDAMSLRIEAQGFARANVPDVSPGLKRRQFVLTTGATLSGRVLLQGKPLKNVGIGVVGQDRSMGEFTGDFVIATQASGRFLFVNLPPGRNYALYGLMEGLQPFGALPVRTVRVKGDDSVTDVGDLNITPGHRLSGQVKLSDGAPLPENSRLLLGRPEAWDTLTQELPPDGRFVFANVPTESLTLSTSMPGYRLSDRNASLDRLNPFQLVGRLSSDKTNLLVVLEPGRDLPPELSSQPDEERPEKLPLCGAEGKRVIPNAVTFSGQVLDAETKARLPQFRVTPGLRRDPRIEGWTEWYKPKAVEGTNGAFSLELSLKTGAVVLMAEADGYLPALSQELTRGHSNSVIALRKGVGPRGTLVLPDGKPADGVPVCYLVAGEQAALSAEGVFSFYGERERPVELTDPEGDFSFTPKLGEGEIFAAGDKGFAHCRTAELAANGKLTLQPWGSIHGRLVRNGKPVAGENLDLDCPTQSGFGQPRLNLFGVHTGEDGQFALAHVPPGELELTTRISLTGGQSTGWTTHRQRKFTLKPGEDLDLGSIQKSSPTR